MQFKETGIKTSLKPAVDVTLLPEGRARVLFTEAMRDVPDLLSKLTYVARNYKTASSDDGGAFSRSVGYAIDEAAQEGAGIAKKLKTVANITSDTSAQHQLVHTAQRFEEITQTFDHVRYVLGADFANKKGKYMKAMRAVLYDRTDPQSRQYMFNNGIHGIRQAANLAERMYLHVDPRTRSNVASLAIKLRLKAAYTAAADNSFNAAIEDVEIARTLAEKFGARRQLVNDVENADDAISKAQDAMTGLLLAATTGLLIAAKR